MSRDERDILGIGRPLYRSNEDTIETLNARENRVRTGLSVYAGSTASCGLCQDLSHAAGMLPCHAKPGPVAWSCNPATWRLGL